MTFDEQGYLIPYDCIPATLADIEAVFVQSMPLSATRQTIFNEFKEYLHSLQRMLNAPLEVWVNGSFTTLKLNPNDIDFVIFVDTQVATRHYETIRQFRDRRLPKGAVTDGYFMETVPTGHHDFRIYQLNRMDRFRDFAFNRFNKRKGFLQLIFDKDGRAINE